LEKAKEEAERRANQRKEDDDSSDPNKKKKKVGFAATSQGGFGASGSSDIQMRMRPILSDEHEQT